MLRCCPLSLVLLSVLFHISTHWQGLWWICCIEIIFHSFCLQNGISPLYVACMKGHTAVVHILIKAGADIHQATEVCIISAKCPVDSDVNSDI